MLSYRWTFMLVLGGLATAAAGGAGGYWIGTREPIEERLAKRVVEARAAAAQACRVGPSADELRRFREQVSHEDLGRFLDQLVEEAEKRNAFEALARCEEEQRAVQQAELAMALYVSRGRR